MKVVRFSYAGASAKLEKRDEGVYLLSSLYSQRRGEGHATEVMRKIVRYADEYNLVLELLVQRFKYADDKALNNTQLEEFYSKFGFELDGRSIRPFSMTRLPNRKDL